MKYEYSMYAYKKWDGKLLRKEGSNSLPYFDRYKGKENYEIVITDKKGNIIYDERGD